MKIIFLYYFINDDNLGDYDINNNKKNSNEDNLNKMNYEFFPNDGDINNNQMMNQNRKGYNSANKQGKTQKNDILGFNNDFLNNNKTIKH